MPIVLENRGWQATPAWSGRHEVRLDGAIGLQPARRIEGIAIEDATLHQMLRNNMQHLMHCELAAGDHNRPRTGIKTPEGIEGPTFRLSTIHLLVDVGFSRPHQH